MKFTFPQLNLFSFWFGFALATVFWLVILRISKLLPKMRQSIAENRLRTISKKNIGIEHKIRIVTYRTAQSVHLASSLFPLEKVLIEPSVLVPPNFLNDSSLENLSEGAVSVLPFTPEVPELLADFPTREVELDQLLRSDQYLCLMGMPGSGKSTALAALSSQLASSETDLLPIFIPFWWFQNASDSPISQIVNYLSENNPGLSPNSIEELIEQSASRSHLVLFFDSLDELSRADFDKAVDWIKALQVMLPGAKIVTTSSAYYTGKLEEIGFSIYTLTAWNREKRNKLIQLWTNVWFEVFKTSNTEDEIAEKQKYKKISLWLIQSHKEMSPFELTLKVWLSLAGEIQEPQSNRLIDGFLTYISGHLISAEGFSSIADSMDNFDTILIAQDKLSEILNSTSDAHLPTEFDQPLEINSKRTSSPGARSTDKKISAKSMVEFLLSINFLLPVDSNHLRFSHLNFLGHLKSLSNAKTPIPPVDEALKSPLALSYLINLDFEGGVRSECVSWLDQNDTPIYRNYLSGLNWLDNLSYTDPLRVTLYKRVARFLQDSSLTVGLRSRLLYFITHTNDNSILSLLEMLKSNRDPSIRQLAALGFGMFSDERSVISLIDLSTDSSNDVQLYSALSLSRIWSTTAQDALVNMIFSADESVRATVCELLSHHKSDGHDMLKQIITTDNYLARKAAIAGLSLISDPWVKPAIEKMSVEDPQWVVRDSAINALGILDQKITYLPDKWLPVFENPWTLEKSNEIGIEVSSKVYPEQLLSTIFVKGNDNDKRIALHYLMDHPTPQFVKTLNAVARQPDSGIREDAINALFCLSKRGLEVN